MRTKSLVKNAIPETPNRRKRIISLFIIIAIIISILPAQAQMKTEYDDPELYWKHYPYQPPGTDIVFPTDEGAHDTEQFPIEWWYVNFHLTGQTTGKEYGSFVAFYKIQTTLVDKKEIRIFSISDIATEKTYTNAQIGTLTANPDHLELSFQYVTNSYDTNNQTIAETSDQSALSDDKKSTVETEFSAITMNSVNQYSPEGTMQAGNTQTTNAYNEINDEYERMTNESTQLQYDQWYTKSNNQHLLPFKYTLVVSGDSQQNHQPMKLAVDMDCLKKPLIVGGDGIIYFRDYDFSFYYSLTKLFVTGKITLNKFTENISGSAWIDHQWGNYVNQNPPQFGMTMTYEWFSIQLNDNREIIVGDIWDRETGEKINQSYTDGLNICNNDGHPELLKTYTITPMGFWNNTENTRLYSSQWHIIETTKSIDLIVTPMFPNQMMRFMEKYPLIQQILEELFPAACFWEGKCTVSGTINGVPVNGKSYVELTHYYDNIEERISYKAI